MAIVLESFAASDSSISFGLFGVTLPSGISANDVLVMVISHDSTADTNPFTTPTGWTLIFHAGDSTTDCHVAAFYKVAMGSEGSTEYVYQDTGYACAYVLRFSGADTTNPVDGYGSETLSTSGYSVSIDGYTVSTSGTYCLAVSAHDGSDGYSASNGTAGWTDLDSGNFVPSSSADGVSAHIAYDAGVGSGPTGSCNVSYSSVDGSAGFIVGIAPSGGASSQTITGSTVSDSDSFGAGTISTGAVSISGATFDDSTDSFGAGSLACPK